MRSPGRVCAGRSGCAFCAASTLPCTPPGCVAARRYDLCRSHARPPTARRPQDRLDRRSYFPRRCRRRAPRAARRPTPTARRSPPPPPARRARPPPAARARPPPFPPPPLRPPRAARAPPRRSPPPTLTAVAKVQAGKQSWGAAELPSGPGGLPPLLSPPVRRLQCTAVLTLPAPACPRARRGACSGATRSPRALPRPAQGEIWPDSLSHGSLLERAPRVPPPAKGPFMLHPLLITIAKKQSGTGGTARGRCCSRSSRSLTRWRRTTRGCESTCASTATPAACS